MSARSRSRVMRRNTTLSWILRDEGHYAEAGKLARQIVDIRRRVLGPDHPFTPQSEFALADILKLEGRYAEAEKLLRETLEIRRRTLPEENLRTASTAYKLARSIARQNRRDEAISLLQDAVKHGLAIDITLGMDKDPALKCLHGDPRFEALVAESHQAAASTK